MTFTYRETQIVKGMLVRGDRQHDIASYFGVNGGRVAEVSTGQCDYPDAVPSSGEKLPPPGPYVGAKTVFEIVEAINDTIRLIREAGTDSDESIVALEAMEALKGKL